MGSLSESVETIAGKAENVGYQHLFSLPLMCSKGFSVGVVKMKCVEELTFKILNNAKRHFLS